MSDEIEVIPEEEAYPEAIWNLVDAVSISQGGRRAFYPPIATQPPGWSAVGPLDHQLLQPTDEAHVTDAQGRSTMIPFQMEIIPPPNGFEPETSSDGTVTLPHPLIRLHAVAKGMLKFHKKDANREDRLELVLPSFSLSLDTIFNMPAWWQRWVDAKCIPASLFYEPIDKDELRTLLESIKVPGPDDLYYPNMPSTHGASFPYGVDESSKQTFIDEFMEGQEFAAGVGSPTAHRFIFVEAGAYIGTAVKSTLTTETNPLFQQRRVTLHAYYQDHDPATNPQPMNPRELMYLLFGDSSAEAKNHPLFVSMEAHGEADQSTHPDSKRMYMRPPLRTWKRVIWEARREVDHHSAAWKTGPAINEDRFYNTHERNGVTFNDGGSGGGYQNGFKCNLFASDIVLRAGFRCLIHKLSNRNRFHYDAANQYTNAAQIALNKANEKGDKVDRVELKGAKEDSEQTWGHTLQNWLESHKDEQDFYHELNAAMHVEGRCFVLAGARGRGYKKRKFVIDHPEPQKDESFWAVVDCGDHKTRSGHIVLVDKILSKPALYNYGGLKHLKIYTYEAAGGAIHGTGWQGRGKTFKADGNHTGANPSSVKQFVRMHLLEMQPGRDPDTPQGLRDLNVIRNAEFLLGDKAKQSETAPKTRLTHDTNGNPRTDNKCCSDNWPPSKSTSEGSCG